VKSINNIRPRSKIGGGTKFAPIFKYANSTATNLLIYFTDGKGEEESYVKPKGYKVMWVLTGQGDKLSLKEPFGTIKKLKTVEIKKDTIDLLDIKNEGWSMNSQQPII
jgi:predicted metal-dependent peptidase